MDLPEIFEDNRKQASEWIESKKGKGILITEDENGVSTIFLGDPDAFEKPPEEQVDSEVFKMFLAVMATYLPGSSAVQLDQHVQTMTALQAINQNLGTFIQLVKKLNPSIRIEERKANSAGGSGIILG